MPTYKISGIIEDPGDAARAGCPCDRQLPYEGCLVAEENELGEMVLDALIDAADEECAVGILDGLLNGVEFNIVTCEESALEDSGGAGERDGYLAWGKVV